MPKLNFIDEMGRMGIPVINLDDDQIHFDALVENNIYIRKELIDRVLKADSRIRSQDRERRGARPANLPTCRVSLDFTHDAHYHGSLPHQLGVV